MPKSAELPGLRESMDLPHGIDLQYDGEVQDLLGHIAEKELRIQGFILESRRIMDRILDKLIHPFLIRFAKDRLQETFGDLGDVRAICFEHHPTFDQKLFVIAKKSGLERSLSIFADGHESAEFLQKIDRKEILQGLLRVEGVELDAMALSGEDFADLGGFLALLREKEGGDSSIRIPTFKCNRENREKMGRLFGLEPLQSSK